MDTHVKVVGWLWIVNGLGGLLTLIAGLVAINWPDVITEPGVSLFATLGSLCLFLPGVVADFVAGAFVLQYRNWARILIIILAVLNIALFCYLILPAVLGIYTLWVMFNDETKALFGAAGSAV